MADMINSVNMERLKKGEVNLGVSDLVIAFAFLNLTPIPHARPLSWPSRSMEA